ncbi:attractin-like isoform X2 [Anneissia japonica]|uniref:attractin-like isoform X2 n=1 Tax=Anneissia japonica TaxID=1529436 RepID=UPI00142574C8|nr:attractin-like isoform X2 [Anneissia japonica]
MSFDMILSFGFAKSKFRRLSVVMYSKHICVTLLYISLLLNVLVQSCNNTEDCLNGGVCSEGTCKCNPGWIGDKCDHCGGRIRLNSTSGIIHESAGDYSTNSKCTWLLDSGKPGSTIDLKVETFSTECSWDYLYVYDGDSVFSRQLAAFSGLIKHKDVNVDHEMRATSGYAYLHFYSDAAYTLDGFNISYSVNSCPSECSNRGSCTSDLQCNCYPDWYGKSCGLDQCPSNCSINGICNNNGCQCSAGYKGLDCKTEPSEGVWQVRETSLVGKASHAMVIDNQYIWNIGGFFFDSDQYIALVQYDLEASGQNIEKQIFTDPSTTPLQRYGHSAVLYQDFIYMFGGDVDGKTTNELWAFDTFNKTWDVNLTTTNAVAVEGHTAHVVDNRMLVFFGFNPSYGYTNLVQEYDFTNDTWRQHETQGAYVEGSYGHSSVYDPKRRKVYLHGGFQSQIPSSDQYISTELHSYDVDMQAWFTLKESSLPRYLHSAVLIDDIMFVFGGNMHNDTRSSNGAKCYSSEFMAYDLECGVWSSIPATSALPKDIARYGHAAATYEQSMVVTGGFNGQMFRDILIYELGNCSALSEADCIQGKPGLKCAYDIQLEECIPASQASRESGNYSLLLCPQHEMVECSSLKSCTDCLDRFGCGWCNGECSRECPANSTCPEEELCSFYRSCAACNYHEDRCVWNRIKCITKVIGSSQPSQCPATCQDYNTCESCAENEPCMWCNNQMQCVESNTYVTSFPYGLCMEWHNIKSQCPPPNCSGYQSCTECQLSPACGWCDDGSGTGTGTCMEGGFTGPLDSSGSEMVLNMSMCHTHLWNFIGCPSCQCNGHSTCVNGSACLNCTNNTAGEHCEECASGFFGNPRNGGSCAPCVCNENADVCDIHTGACYCTTKGIIGDMCDVCDTKAKYRGNPSDGGTCYYELEMNFRYNFNLSKPEDSYYTRINMLVEPNRDKRDIDFILNVPSPVTMNITYSTNCQVEEIPLESGVIVTTKYSTKFTHNEFDFSEDANTTFYIYLYDFTTPYWFEVTLKYHNDLLRIVLEIVLIFVSSLILMLFVMTAGWRVRHVLYRYRLRQRRVVELRMMASRPCATINLELERNRPPDLLPSGKKSYPNVIAFEPCSEQKAAVASLFMQIPLPDNCEVPYGQTRIVLASALVQMKHKKIDMRDVTGARHRKQQQRVPVDEASNCAHEVV